MRACKHHSVCQDMCVGSVELRPPERHGRQGIMARNATHIDPHKAQVDDLPVGVCPIQRQKVPLWICKIAQITYVNG